MVGGELIWVVDDEPAIRQLLAVIVEGAGHRPEQFSSGAEALASAGPPPSAVLLDLMMPGIGGEAVLKELRRRFPTLPVIVVTAVDEISRAVELTKLGAYDYLTKPIDHERLVTTIGRALSHHSLQDEVGRLRRELGDRYHLRTLIGSSAAMLRVYELVERVLSSEITVFISGESGTGKELVAKAIHYGSLRSAGPFVDVNCAAIPEGLQESELFGHEKGAFTGAVSSHPGKFEQGAGGTVFLDEVGEMSPSAQARLLRVLQERALQRVGGTRRIELDVRMISASNRQLEQLVAEGSFRQDLYYRLVVFPIHLPPLRERREDIPALVEHFLAKYATDVGKRITSIEPRAIQYLVDYDWPGNVRELENVVHRSLLSCRGSILELPDLPSGLAGGGPAAAPPVAGQGASLQELERSAIAAALERHQGNLSDAARELGIGRSTLYRKLEQYGLRSKREE